MMSSRFLRLVVPTIGAVTTGTRVNADVIDQSEIRHTILMQTPSNSNLGHADPFLFGYLFHPEMQIES